MIAEVSSLSNTHPLWILGFTFALTLVPLLIGATTSYLKISIVLALLRNGLGLQQSPNALVVMVLALALSFLVMGPAIRETNKIAQTVSLAKLKSAPSTEVLARLMEVIKPWRTFLERHAGSNEVRALRELSLEAQSAEAPPTLDILIPAFVLSELKEAFSMGFLLLLPFLVIDLVVANILAGLGMYMVSPAMISLPLKLLLFVSVDGWLLLSRALVLSYGGQIVS